MEKVPAQPHPEMLMNHQGRAVSCQECHVEAGVWEGTRYVCSEHVEWGYTGQEQERSDYGRSPAWAAHMAPSLWAPDTTACGK